MNSERLNAPLVALADLAAQGAEPKRIAAEAVATWRNVYGTLAPIVGNRGVCALYQRSLHLARPEFPWLGAVHATALDSGDFDALREALSQQPSAIGVAANNSVLTIFCTLLSQLIGESLTERLLGSVWNGISDGALP